MKKGTVYWITGLSGAGKTTIGTELLNYIKEKKNNVVILDGDALREVYRNSDYTLEGRKEIAFRTARLCRMLSDQGIDVVCCIIAMFDDVRRWNRENIYKYKEMYIKVEMEVLIERDQKQLYSRAIKKEINNVMGIDLEFEEPITPDIIINNNGDKNPKKLVKEIVELMKV